MKPALESDKVYTREDFINWLEEAQMLQEGLDLEGVNFSAANFDDLDCRIAGSNGEFLTLNLKFSNLEGLSCKRASFDNVDMTLSNITRADFSGSQIRNSCMDFLEETEGADFSNSVLEQVSFVCSILAPVKFHGADMERTEGMDLLNSSFRSLLGAKVPQMYSGIKSLLVVSDGN